MWVGCRFLFANHLNSTNLVAKSVLAEKLGFLFSLFAKSVFGREIKVWFSGKIGIASKRLATSLFCLFVCLF